MSKKFLGDIIFEYRKSKNLSMDEFAKLSGMSKAYIGMLEKNINPSTNKPITPTLNTYKNIANAMNVDLDILLKMLSPESDVILSSDIDIEKIPGIIPLKRTRKIPILGTVACGTPVFAEENYEGYFIADEIIKADFCLHCRGDSMIDANINDGDLVFVKKTNTVENGTIAVVMIDDCATLKRVTKIDDNYILQPANKNYEPIILSEDHENLIIGEMVGVYSARNK